MLRRVIAQMLSFFRADKPVSHSRLCKYAAGLFRSGFNLLAEVPDVYPESLNVGLGAFPCLRQEMAVREHLTLMQQQFMEQAIFAWGQLGIYAANPHQTTRKVDAKVAIVVDGGTALHLYTMTQGCPGTVVDIYNNDYRMGLIDSTFDGAGDPRLTAAMAALSKPMTPADLESQLQTIAEVRKRPLDEIRQEYEEYVQQRIDVENKITAKNLEPIIEVITAANADVVALQELIVGRGQGGNVVARQTGRSILQRSTPGLTRARVDDPHIAILRSWRKVTLTAPRKTMQPIGTTGQHDPFAVVCSHGVRLQGR